MFEKQGKTYRKERDNHGLIAYLDELVETYNCTGFIENDPIQIPHSLSKVQDKEIMGFWVAMLAWGQRVSIIKSAKRLIELMDGCPFDFISQHQEHDLKRFLNFCHRTFQPDDALYFIAFFRNYYQHHSTLETAFSKFIHEDDETIENGLIGFHKEFFSLPFAMERTKKHIATPERKSTCKRLNMFLRWMVREDGKGVDLGLWKTIKPSQLLIPLDVHVDRVARSFGLIERKQTDWQTVLELTALLKTFDSNDPVKYDFALFGSGVASKKHPLL